MRHKEKEDKAKKTIIFKIVAKRTIERSIEIHARIKLNSTWFTKSDT
jgi:hypothetical protein